MIKFKECIDKLANRLHIRKDRILPFLFAVSLTIVFFLDSTYFNNRALYVLAILALLALATVVSIIAIQAGFTILKSLFLLSAELSLLFLLAQSYCDATSVASAGDNALRTLVGLGIAYISYRFYVELKEALKKKLESLPQKGWPKEKVIVVLIFLFYAFVFIYGIYQVVSPIVLDLCVFKR